MEFILSRERSLVSNEFCKTPLEFRQWVFMHNYNKHTRQQLIFVLLTKLFFKRPLEEGSYIISAIGTCHELVPPLIKFSSMLYGEDESKFFVVHIRKDMTNPNIKIFGIDKQFKRILSENMHGHTAVCIRKNEKYYVFDILLGLLTPVKLDDYLSIIVDEKNAWIHILSMKQDNGRLRYSVEYDDLTYKITKQTSSIRSIINVNLKNYMLGK